jgi:hypothetical protein
MLSYHTGQKKASAQMSTEKEKLKLKNARGSGEVTAYSIRVDLSGPGHSP